MRHEQCFTFVEYHHGMVYHSGNTLDIWEQIPTGTWIKDNSRRNRILFGLDRWVCDINCVTWEQIASWHLLKCVQDSHFVTWTNHFNYISLHSFGYLSTQYGPIYLPLMYSRHGCNHTDNKESPVYKASDLPEFFVFQLKHLLWFQCTKGWNHSTRWLEIQMNPGSYCSRPMKRLRRKIHMHHPAHASIMLPIKLRHRDVGSFFLRGTYSDPW